MIVAGARVQLPDLFFFFNTLQLTSIQCGAMSKLVCNGGFCIVMCCDDNINS